MERAAETREEENARLRGELAELRAERAATADVLRAIGSAALDLGAVLRSLLQSAVQLSEAEHGTITRQRDGRFYRAETVGFSREFIEMVRDTPVALDRSSISGRTLLDRRIVHIPDITLDPEYRFEAAIAHGAFRSTLGVPLLRDGVAVGVIAVTRREPVPFTPRQIALVSGFADQAAIAIENARLFDEVQARTRELQRSLEDLRTAQARLVESEKLASLGRLTAGIAHELKNPLNFITNFAGLSSELVDELTEALGRRAGPEAEADLAEITGLLRGNLAKIVHHGARADSIIRNMLAHSRGGGGERRRVAVNQLVEEALNLAWHGDRSTHRDLDATLETALDPAAGEASVLPQELGRALLNVIGNGFHALRERSAAGAEVGWIPTLLVATRDLGGSVEIRIRDNGPGIPVELRSRIFEPFFTTKAAGEGTGLGLSLTRDIVVKQHGGTLEVESAPGSFTEFRIVLPRDDADGQRP